MQNTRHVLIVGMRDEAINKIFSDFHILIPGQDFAHLKFDTAFSGTNPRDTELHWWKAIERQTVDKKIHWLF